MSRAPLALALLLACGRADAAPKAKDPRLALKFAACSQDSPPLLVQLPPDRQGTESASPQQPTRLDRRDRAACEEKVSALPDSAQLAFSPSGDRGASPDAPVTEEEASRAFSGQTQTVGALSARLQSFAQQQSLDLDVLAGQKLFDNASDAASAKARRELSGALKQELGVPAASAAEPPKDYPRPGKQPHLDAATPPALAPGQETAAQPGTTLSDIPLIGRAVNHFAPGYSDVPLNPRNWPSSPPADLARPLNPNGTPAPPGLQPKGDKTSGAPIWSPFVQKLKACRPDCQPQEYGIWRPSDPTSCHYSGAAIDLHSIKCSDGRVYKAIESGKDSGPFADLVTCMRSDKGGGHLFAIWHQCFKNCGHDVTSNHMDHTHLSIGCGHGRK